MTFGFSTRVQTVSFKNDFSAGTLKLVYFSTRVILANFTEQYVSSWLHITVYFSIESCL
jgi:hypothetical protein